MVHISLVDFVGIQLYTVLECVIWCVAVADGGGSRGCRAFNMVCSWVAAETHLLVRLHAEVCPWPQLGLRVRELTHCSQTMSS